MKYYTKFLSLDMHSSLGCGLEDKQNMDTLTCITVKVSVVYYLNPIFSFYMFSYLYLTGTTLLFALAKYVSL